MNNQYKNPIEILLVEDNPADILLMKEAIAQVNVPHHLHSVADGLHAMSFLRKQGKYSSSPRPDIIFLDLNLPVKDGREVLSELKKDPNLRRIPVVVLTTSSREQDIDSAYDLNANCYIVKPIDFEQFCNTVKAIQNFWFTTAKLPSNRA
jgi:two-component system, chemotaxis family, response regulator Rcp1